MDSILSNCRFPEVTQIIDMQLNDKDLEKAKFVFESGKQLARNDIVKINNDGKNGFKIQVKNGKSISFVSRKKENGFNEMYSKMLYFIKEAMQLKSIDDIPLENTQRKVEKSEREMERADVKKEDEIKRIIDSGASIKNIILEKWKGKTASHKINFSNGESIMFMSKTLSEEDNFNRIVVFLEKIKYKKLEKIKNDYLGKKEKIETSTPVLDFDGYLATNDGKILSTKRGMCKELKERHEVYKSVGLYKKDGNRKTITTHRVIVTTFKEKPEGKNLVNHIDGVKTNNHKDNLEWCTVQENADHASKTGLLKKKPKEKDPIYIESRDWKIIEKFNQYRISEDGRVWSDKNMSLLYPEEHEGKLKVWLNKNHRTNVDALVAKAYISNPDKKRFIIHLDKDLYNCRKENLEWSSTYVKYEKKERIENSVSEYEKYKPWKKLEGLINYEFSYYGKIFSCKLNEVISCEKRPDNYIGTDLIDDNGKRDRTLVHVLIAKAWIRNPDPETKTQVDHINRKRDDNRVENLRWCTPSENCKWAASNKAGLTVYKNDIEIANFDSIKETVEGMSEMFKDLSFNSGCISHACSHGKLYKGFFFERKE
jgi:HNH endonuclease